MQKNRWSVGLAAFALTSLAACGGGDSEELSDTTQSESSSEGAELEALSSEEAEQALIPQAAMGEEFTAIEPSEEEGDADLGCLSALDEMDDIGAETEAEVEYVPADDSGFPSVESSVFSYTDTERISTRMEEVSTALAGCESVDVTDDEGTRFQLDVSLENEVVTEGADEQVTLEASGTISSPDQEVPITLHMSSVRIDNHVTVVVYSDLTEDVTQSASEFDSYVSAATDRLVAVVAGQTPEDEPIA